MKSLGFKKTQGATVSSLMKYIAPCVLAEYTMDGKKYRGQVKKAFKDTKFCQAMRGQYHNQKTGVIYLYIHTFFKATRLLSLQPEILAKN